MKRTLWCVVAALAFLLAVPTANAETGKANKAPVAKKQSQSNALATSAKSASLNNLADWSDQEMFPLGTKDYCGKCKCKKCKYKGAKYKCKKCKCKRCGTYGKRKCKKCKCASCGYKGMKYKCHGCKCKCKY